MDKSINDLIKQCQSLLTKYDSFNCDNKAVMQANSPTAFNKLSKDKQYKLVRYCIQSFIQRKTPNDSWSSYGLKHFFENEEENSFYVSNGQFKGAMLIAGFTPVAPQELNWIYCISQKSPALIKHNNYIMER